VRIAGCLIAAFVIVSAANAASTKTAEPRQQLVVAERDYRMETTGSADLHAGWVTVTVSNRGQAAHALLVVRLKRPLTNKQVAAILGANVPAKAMAALETFGGIQDVPPGKSWQMTTRLEPGRYLLIDYAENGGKPNYVRGMQQRFTVAAGGPAGAPPRAVGRIVMADFAFAISLPERFGGNGNVQIPNRGRQWHEISLVKTPAGKHAQDVLTLIHAGAQRPPPGYEIHELLAVVDPGKIVYVRFNLQPGHYVALCLVDDRKTGKLHADLGMVGEFDVA
jgi:hypothetical protein